MKFDPNENYLTKDEAAFMMNKSISRIVQYCDTKQIKFIIWGKRSIMILESSVREYMSKDHPTGRPKGYSPSKKGKKIEIKKVKKFKIKRKKL